MGESRKMMTLRQLAAAITEKPEALAVVVRILNQDTPLAGRLKEILKGLTEEVGPSQLQLVKQFDGLLTPSAQQVPGSGLAQNLAALEELAKAIAEKPEALAVVAGIMNQSTPLTNQLREILEGQSGETRLNQQLDGLLLPASGSDPAQNLADAAGLTREELIAGTQLVAYWGDVPFKALYEVADRQSTPVTRKKQMFRPDLEGPARQAFPAMMEMVGEAAIQRPHYYLRWVEKTVHAAALIKNNQGVAGVPADLPAMLELWKPVPKIFKASRQTVTWDKRERTAEIEQRRQTVLERVAEAAGVDSAILGQGLRVATDRQARKALSWVAPSSTWDDARYQAVEAAIGEDSNLLEPGEKKGRVTRLLRKVETICALAGSTAIAERAAAVGEPDIFQYVASQSDRIPKPAVSKGKHYGSPKNP